MSSHVRYEVADQIATITLDRPEKRNAMSYAMLGEFIESVGRAGADADAHVVIVTGSGGSFCAGTDLADLQTIPGEQRGLRGEAQEKSRWWPLVACPKPVIGAIDGAAVGMGAEFTSQCDVRIASTRARFAWNFAHRGLVPDTGAGTWLLPRLIGSARALRLLYSGAFLPAEEALAIGYVARVVAPEALADAAREEAQAFLAGSPLSHRLIKELVYAGFERGVSEHMSHHRESLTVCFRSADHKEGVASFLERRPARFSGA
ncbi:MAG: enoyl-CoA hydratase/isomerase family protein [bacterium]